MTIYELKQSLKAQNLASYYIFFGPEVVIMDTYIHKIAEAKNCNIVRGLDFLTVSKRLTSRGIFSNNSLYLINEDKGFLSDAKAHDLVKNYKGNNIVVFCYNDIDKRSKLYNEFKDSIIEVEKLSLEVMIKRIKNDYHLNDVNSEKLSNRCNLDYNKVLMVCNKLRIVSELDNKNINEVFDDFIDEGLIPISIENILFEFIDIVLSGNYKYAWKYIDLLKMNNEPSIQVISILYTNVRSLMLYEACDKKSNVSAKTGVEMWQLNKVKDYLGIYNVSQLVRILKVIRDTEIGIKTGTIDTEWALQHCILNMQFIYYE